MGLTRLQKAIRQLTHLAASTSSHPHEKSPILRPCDIHIDWSCYFLKCQQFVGSGTATCKLSSTPKSVASVPDKAVILSLPATHFDLGYIDRLLKASGSDQGLKRSVFGDFIMILRSTSDPVASRMLRLFSQSHLQRNILGKMLARMLATIFTGTHVPGRSLGVSLLLATVHVDL